MALPVLSLTWLTAPRWQSKAEARRELDRLLAEQRGVDYAFWADHLDQTKRVEFTSVATLGIRGLSSRSGMTSPMAPSAFWSVSTMAVWVRTGRSATLFWLNQMVKARGRQVLPPRCADELVMEIVPATQQLFRKADHPNV